MKKTRNRNVQRISFVFLLFVIAFVIGCAPASRNGDSTSYTSIKATSQDSTSNPISTPVPTIPVIREFEQDVEASKLTVISGETNAVIIGNDQVVELQGVIASAEYAADKSKVAMLFDQNNEGIGRLVYFDGTRTTDIASDVNSFRISCDGNTIAYLKGSYVEGVGSELNIYDCKTGETHLVAESAGGQFVLSPKGKAIAYTVFNDPGNSDQWSINISVEGGSPEKLGEEKSPAALTDDGSLVYATGFQDGDDKKILNVELVVFYEKIQQTLSTSISQMNSMFVFNKDCTQLLFNDKKGLYFYQSGSEVKLIEPLAKIVRLENKCKTDSFVIFHGRFQSSGSVTYNSVYSGTTNLCNVLYQIEYQDQNTGRLMYFTEDFSTVLLTSFWWGTTFDQAGKTILVFDMSNNQKELIYVKDIYSPKFGKEYDNSTEKHFNVYIDRNYYLTSGGTIYFYSGKGGKDDRINGSMIACEMSSIKVDGDTAPVVISPNCVRMEKYEREGKPDIIYYLEYKYSEPQTTVNEKEYVSWYYYDLYMIEDIPGAKTVLIAENVGDFGCGDFGVYYLQYKSISPDFINSFAGQTDDEDFYDQNKLYYSSDGLTFKYQTNIEKRYFFAG